jgi:spore maturation protein CgeB
VKILFIAELRDTSRARQRLLALRDLGHEVEEFSTIPETEDYNTLFSFWHRIRWKLGYPLDLIDLNHKLPTHAIEFSPDLIWVEKVLTIRQSTYQDLRIALPQTKIVFYSEDDIFLKHNCSIYLKKSLPFFDLVFTTKPRNLEELPQLGVKRVFCVYQAYDRNTHRPISLSLEEKSQWGSDVSFIGTFERDRATQMLQLAKQGIQLRIWGSDWHKWQHSHPNMQIEHRAVYNADFIKVINASKINLNFLRKSNRDRHTSRSLEIPACEAFMLAERTDEHLNLFDEGNEAEFFDTLSELLKKIQYYLNHEEERARIANSGRIRCLTSGYSHHERLNFMLDQIEFRDNKLSNLSSL